jgi:outer membrane biosynthesis protein TonB
MQAGLPTSIALHVSLLALALVSWGRSHDDAVQPVEAIEVEIGDTTQVRLGSRTGQKMDEIQAKEQAAAAKEREGKRAGVSRQEEPPPKPEAKPEPPKEVASIPKSEPPPPKPEVKPEPPKPVAKPEEKPPEEKKAAEKAPEIAKEPPPPKPPEKKEPPKEPPKDAAALDKLVAKADAKPTPLPPKADAAKAAAKPAAPAPAPSPTAAKAATGFNSKEISDILNKSATGTAAGKTAQVASLGSPNGVNAKIKMSVSELDAFMAQVQKCWNPPPGASEAELMARIQVVLQPDGSLAATPQTIEAPSHPMGPAYAASAIRAIRMCAPYRLPAAKYEQWHDNVLTFVPKL